MIWFACLLNSSCLYFGTRAMHSVNIFKYSIKIRVKTNFSWKFSSDYDVIISVNLIIWMHRKWPCFVEIRILRKYFHENYVFLAFGNEMSVLIKNKIFVKPKLSNFHQIKFQFDIRKKQNPFALPYWDIWKLIIVELNKPKHF